MYRTFATTTAYPRDPRRRAPVAGPPATCPPAARPSVAPAFTLIELLVVIAIIGTLLAIVLPSMSRARAASKNSVCLTNLRELSLAVQAYSMGADGAIPRGPDTPIPYAPTSRWCDWATNQLMIGNQSKPNGLGTLFAHDLKQPRVLFCPADDSNDPSEELAKLEPFNGQDVFSSYMYRQLDQTTKDRFDDLGRNAANTPARALVFDVNSLAPGALGRTNHGGKKVNIVYLDSHAQTADNRNDLFSLRGQDYAGFPASIEQRLNNILVAADFAENGDPNSAPTVP